VTTKYLEHTDPRLKSLDKRDGRLRAFTSALVILLGVTVVTLYLPQVWGQSVQFLPAPETHTTLAIGILGLAVLFYLYVMKKLGQLTDVRRELLGTRLREELLRGRLSELSSLFETTAHANLRVDRDEMLDLIVRRVLICLEADQCSIFLLDAEAKELTCSAVTGRDEEFVRGARMPIGEGIAGWVAAHNEPIVLDDAEMSTRFPQERKRGRDISSSLCVPLAARSRVIGVLCINRLERHNPFTAMDARLVTIFAEHIAGAVMRLDEWSDMDRRASVLAASNEHLARVQRLHDVFLAAARYEMRTPLAAIRASADLLRRDGQTMPPERHDRLTLAVQEQAHHLREILNEILDLSRLEAGEVRLSRHLLSPNEPLLLAAQAVEAQAARRGIHISVEPSAEVPPLSLDATKWKRALVNLLSSALRMSSSGDTIRVQSLVQDGNVEIAITGFGSGASGEDLRQFAQAFAENGGRRSATARLGLGAFVAKRYLEMHGVAADFAIVRPGEAQYRVAVPADRPEAILVADTDDTTEDTETISGADPDADLEDATRDEPAPVMEHPEPPVGKEAA
jgi:K+-sensing histidine kinase KdpD